MQTWSLSAPSTRRVESDYLQVIRAIAYVIAHQQEFNIRVLNLSFSGTPIVPLLARSFEFGGDGSLARRNRGFGVSR